MTNRPFGARLAGAMETRGPLCVGIDPHPSLLAAWGLEMTPSGLERFAMTAVEALAPEVAVLKPQSAFFEAFGSAGIAVLERVLAAARDAGALLLLDAKRGDIGSTAEQYAREAFERYGADAVTLSPFMGQDSVEPYLRYPGKGAFLLCRTSNPGGSDLQAQRLADVPGQPLLYEHLAQLVQGPWNTNGQLGLVVGATYPAEIERVRALAPTVPLLIPGVGAQGGDVRATVRAGWRESGPIVVNSSRAILYASGEADFAAAARAAAQSTREQLNAARPLT